MTSATHSSPSTASIGDPIEAAVRANLIRADGHQLSPLIIGIDPGISGALALIDPATMRVWRIADMPTAEANGKRSVSAGLLALTITEWASLASATGRRLLAIVEEVGAMPGQGVTSMFSFGRSFGVILGVLAGCGVALELVRPAAWKKAARISKDKGSARKAAQERFPDAAGVFARVKVVDESQQVKIYGLKRGKRMIEHSQRMLVRTLAPAVRWARLAEWVAEHGGRFTAARMAEDTGEPIEALALTLKAWSDAGWLTRATDSGRSLYGAGPNLPRWGDPSPWSAVLFGALTLVDAEADGRAIEEWKARRTPPPVIGMASGGGTFIGGAWGGAVLPEGGGGGRSVPGRGGPGPAAQAIEPHKGPIYFPAAPGAQSLIERAMGRKP